LQRGAGLLQRGGADVQGRIGLGLQGPQQRPHLAGVAGSEFDPQAFRYEARWQAKHSRIAMALISTREQVVTLAGRRWTFANGEPLISEYSVKYTPEALARLAAAAGWRLQRSWSDTAADLSLHLLHQADSGSASAAPQP